MEKQFDYELKHPFKYAHKGDEVEAGFISLLPPTSRHVGPCADLKQAVFRSLPIVEPGSNQAKNDKDDKDDGLDGTIIMLLIYTSQNVDLKHMLFVARELFTTRPPVALVDGEERTTHKILDDIHPDDFETMVGEYIARFIVASAWGTLNKK